MDPTSKTNQGASAYYDEDYFNWQKSIGAFGGKAESFKFANTVRESDTVIDFGCGGGYLLANLNCAEKIGIEPNESASGEIQKCGVEHFISPGQCREKLGQGFADVIISNHALEHTLDPLGELKALLPLLKEGGVIHFMVPCDSIYYAYDPQDVNYHLFSWSPQNFGNLFTEAGFEVEYSRPYMHKWPPFHQQIAKLGWPIFHLASRIYARLNRSCFQVEIKARKPKDV